MNKMLKAAEVTTLINQGQHLLLAASEELLLTLPQGNWIGGTIPYFMTENGGKISHDLIQVTVLPEEVLAIQTQFYNASEIHRLPDKYYSNGFSFIIIPAFSEVHETYAKNCSTWPSVFNQPLLGWISGVDLAESKPVLPKVMNGKDGKISSDQAIVMHIELKPEFYASTEIINLFTQGHGDTIMFPSQGFDVDHCIINNKEVNFADYLKKKSIDLQLPLVANYMGAMINVSLRDIDESQKNVRLYAPVFPGVEYRFANPIGNYELEFEKVLQRHSPNAFFSCNCVLNFLYAKLEGKQAGNMVSPMTFGEVAYVLLNQTMVYAKIKKIAC